MIENLKKTFKLTTPTQPVNTITVITSIHTNISKYMVTTKKMKKNIKKIKIEDKRSLKLSNKDIEHMILRTLQKILPLLMQHTQPPSQLTQYRKSLREYYMITSK